MNIMTETEVQIQSKFNIKGKISVPNLGLDQYPAVLIIPGTGKGDMDGNFKGLKMNLYKNISDFLVSQGFITLRYEKRGLNGSGGDFLEAGLWDFVDDAIAAVKFLKDHPQVKKDKVLILGHSEGSAIAPAVHNREPVEGLMLISCLGESAKTAFPKQTEMAMKEISQLTGFKGFLVKALKVVEKQEKRTEKTMNKILNAKTPTVRFFGFRVNAKWFQEHYHYNVLDELQSVACPVIAITGSKDIQVDPEHVKLIFKTVQGDSECYIVPNMTHILVDTDEDIKMTEAIKKYKKMVGKPFNQEFLRILSQWLNKIK